jgi:uncharacterized delta-60 repeat protein
MLVIAAAGAIAAGADAAGSAGSLDSSFGTGGKVLTDVGSGSDDGSVAIALQSDKKVVSAGFSNANGSYDFSLARYTKGGSLDPSFGSGGSGSNDIALARYRG